MQRGPPAQPVMPLFWKPYKSDVTTFIEQLKAARPALEDEQRAGRALLWDKRIDRDAQAEVMVRLEENGKTVTGRGADTDTLVASARAYVTALNKLIMKRQRGPSAQSMVS